MTRPLRILLIDEGVLGHRTLTKQLREELAGNPAVEATFVRVPAPGRLGRLLLHRRLLLGDSGLFELRWRLRWSWQVRRLLKRHGGNADVAFITTQAAALLIGRRMRRLPCVLCIDATLEQFVALNYRGTGRAAGRQRILRRLERRALRRAAAAVAMTDWNATALRREYELPDEKIVTIHPGLDASWWATAAVQRKEQNGELRILFVGNDIKRKGLALLTEAVRRPGLISRLDVVTNESCEAGDRVHIHNDLEAGSERLRDLYASADVFALPTRADAVPWSVLEAMAAGLPVVASKVGAIEELVGNSGVMLPTDDSEALAAALRSLDDPQRRRELGRKAMRRVRERYDRSAQVPLLLAVLREAAGGGPSLGEGSRLRRRTLVAAGIGAAGAALAAPYAVLLPNGEFAELVASKLGISPTLAGELLGRARAAYGDIEYEARAAAFALAVRDPAAAVLPASVRERAASSLIEPMLSAPAAKLAYAITGNDPGGVGACAGLVRNR